MAVCVCVCVCVLRCEFKVMCGVCYCAVMCGAVRVLTDWFFFYYARIEI